MPDSQGDTLEYRSHRSSSSGTRKPERRTKTVIRKESSILYNLRNREQTVDSMMCLALMCNA